MLRQNTGTNNLKLDILIAKNIGPTDIKEKHLVYTDNSVSPMGLSTLFSMTYFNYCIPLRGTFSCFLFVLHVMHFLIL